MMIKIREYQNKFSSELSSFKYNRYWNDIPFFTNYIDLSFLILPKYGLPLFSLASRLALTHVYLFLTYFPSYSANICWSWRRLQDMSGRHLQKVFSVTIFRLPRRLQDVLETSWKTKNRYAEDVLKTSWRHVLKTSWR